jgi:hypothetical protein
MQVFMSFFATIFLAIFYPNDSWLNELANMDAYVENDKINLLTIGAEPNVIENNGTWPLTPVQRSDGKAEVNLGTFDTQPAHVTNVEEMETSYSKMESVANQHASALRKKAMLSAAYNIAPVTNTANMPVLTTTGADRGDGTNALTYADILRLNRNFNKYDVPLNNRVILLSPEHEEDLLNEDANRYNLMMTTGKISNFKIYVTNHGVTYDAVTGNKNPIGTLNGQSTSIVFYKNSAIRAMGSLKGEPEYNWALYRGWLFGLQMRFLAIPVLSKGLGAIYSAAC